MMIGVQDAATTYPAGSLGTILDETTLGSEPGVSPGTVRYLLLRR